MSALINGLLTAALALPQAGLVAAYDFARTNFVNWSEDLTQSGWTRAGAVATSVQALLADGTVGPVTRLVDTTANVQHLVASSIFTPPDNTAQSFVWRLKAAEYRYVGVQWANKAATAFPTNIVDLQDGVILNGATGASVGTTFTGTSGGLAYTVTVTPAGNGWYDVTVNVPSVGAGTNSPRPALLLNNAATNTNGYVFAGTGTSGILIQRAQWNAVVAPLPYERTTDGQTLIDRSVRLWPAPAGRINLLSWTEDLNLSPWTLNNATITSGVSDPFGDTRAFTLTGLPITSGSERRLLQTAPPATAGERRTNSVYLRRRTGTGIVQMLTPQNSAWGDLALTGAWQRFTTTGVLGSSVSLFALRLLTDGDQVDVAFPQQEMGSTPSPYVRQTHNITLDMSLKGVNLIPASEGFGAATPATLPLGWSYGNDANVTASVTSVTASAATPGTQDVTLTATNNDTVSRTFRLYLTNMIPPDFTAQPGEVFHFSVGIASNVTGNVSANIYYYNASRGFLGNAGLSAMVTAGNPLTRLGGARAVGGGTDLAHVRPVVEFGLGAGTSRTITVNAPVFNRVDAIPYLRGPAHATLGANAATADPNDPIWTSAGLTFDGVDDYVALPTACQGGDYTLIYAAIPLADYSSVDTKWIDDPVSPLSPYLGPGGGMVAKWRLALTDSTYSYLFNGARVAVGQAYINAVRVSGLQAAMHHNGALAHAVALPAPLKGGALRLGGTANVTYLYRAAYNRALTPAELTQAYRFIRTQLSQQRGITI